MLVSTRRGICLPCRVRRISRDEAVHVHRYWQLLVFSLRAVEADSTSTFIL